MPRPGWRDAIGGEQQDEAGQEERIPHNLPARLTSFVGRRWELSELTKLLEEERLVTLTGAGGVGKSRLAHELAMRVQPRYRGGCWWVELANVVDPELVASAVSAALGVREQPQRPLVDVLAEHLGDRRTLLILDNCEQVSEAVAALVERLLGSCPELRIVVASRQRLGLAGEHLRCLTGLPVPELEEGASSLGEAGDAVRLFVDRAAAVRCGLDQPTKLATIGRICRRLDGLPLAIELAAARTNALSPEAIADHLDERFALLGAGQRSVPARHRDLQTVIDWSYRLLSEAERRLFARLSVFRGGFTLEAATAATAAGSPGEVAHLVCRLVDKSLVATVQATGPVDRYELLETLRAYGRGRLQEAGELTELRARHAEHFLGWVEPAYEGLRGREQSRWLDRLEAEHANLRAALAWYREQEQVEPAMRMTAALYRCWTIRGHYREGRAWLEWVLTASDPDQPRQRARVLLGVATLAVIQGDLSRAAAACEEAIGLARKEEAAAELAHGLQYGGLVAVYHGELEAAEGLLQEALEVAGRAPSATWAEGWALLMLSGLALARRNYEQAAQLAEASEATLDEVADPDALGWALAARAAAASATGQTPEAVSCLRQALQVFERLGGLWGLSLTLVVAARLIAHRGDLEQAVVLIGASEALSGSVGAQALPFIQDWLEETLEEARPVLGSDRLERVKTAGPKLEP